MITAILPAIRFKDDHGTDFPDWEEKKLGEVGNVVPGGTPDSTNETYWNGGVLWFTPTEIKSKYATQSKRTISQLGLKKCSASMLPAGTLLFTSRATIAEVSIATEPCTTNQGFQSITVNPGVHNEFIYNWVIQFKRDFLRKSQGSTFLEIGGKEVRKMPMLLPSFAEQTKIADFLTAVDERIGQLIQKKALLVDYKKGVMQQLFTQAIRFKDDHGNDFPDWEEKKLGDFGQLIHGDGDWILSENITLNGEHKIVQLGNIGFGSYVEKTLKTISIDTFEKLKGTPIIFGDLLLNRMVDGNINSCIFMKDGNYITSVDVCWIRKNPYFDNYFLMSSLLTSNSQKKLLRLSSGSGRVRISKNNLFEKFSFELPCVDEQIKIANVLSAIDRKIESVATQITETQTFKRGLLQQMFV